MIIAMDIDDVVARYTQPMVQYAVVYNKNVVKSNRGLIKPDAKWITKGMFDWTKEDGENFENETIKLVYKNQRVVSGAKQFINLMKQEGHKIYFVTARGVDGHSKRKDTEIWLKEQGIEYDKLFFKVKNKVEVLKRNNVDIYIEDCYDNCIKADKAGIYTIQFCNYPTRYKHTKFKRQINNWQEIYEAVLKRAKTKLLIERYPIIVDSDVSNEIDDEFALSYLFSFLNAQIEAITIAPHFRLKSDVKDVDLEVNVERSYNKAVQIAKLTRPELIEKIYKGDVAFRDYGEGQVSEAVRRIISVCKRNKEVVFISLGACTNLAHALEIEPKIASRIKLYALMGELLPNKIGQEFNLSQDFQSTKIVLEKIKDKHIFTITGFSNLIFTQQDISNNMKGRRNDVVRLLQRDFNRVTKEKFDDIRYKSIYDFIVPFYLAYPAHFIESKQTIKINNTHVLFQPSQNEAYIVSNVNPNLPINDFYQRMKIFDKPAKEKSNEN